MAPTLHTVGSFVIVLHIQQHNSNPQWYHISNLPAHPQTHAHQLILYDSPVSCVSLSLPPSAHSLRFTSAHAPCPTPIGTPPGAETGGALPNPPATPSHFCRQAHHTFAGRLQRSHTLSHNAARWQGGPQQPQHTPSCTMQQGGRVGRSSLNTHLLTQCSKVAGWAAAASTHTLSHKEARWQGGPQQPQQTRSARTPHHAQQHPLLAPPPHTLLQAPNTRLGGPRTRACVEWPLWCAQVAYSLRGMCPSTPLVAPQQTCAE